MMTNLPTYQQLLVEINRKHISERVVLLGKDCNKRAETLLDTRRRLQQYYLTVAQGMSDRGIQETTVSKMVEEGEITHDVYRYFRKLQAV